MALPKQLPLDRMQSIWKSQIDPLLAIPMLKGAQLKAIALASGVNTINHKLSRVQQGYFITDQDAASSIYRSQPFNDKTLVLTSSGTCTVNIWVF